MEADAEPSSPVAPWLPLTPGRAGRLAAFHRGRLAFVAFLTAFLVAGAVLRLAQVAWFPAIQEAISQMPAGTALDGGVLKWPEDGRRMLADNMYLSAAGGAAADAPGVQAADLHLEFTSQALWITWMAGHLRLAYPAGYVIDLDPATLEPLWEAWRPQLYAGVLLGTLLLVWLVWGLIALVFTPFLAGVARLLGRPAGLGTAWWLAVAAFLPGSGLLAVAIFLYGFRYLNLPMAMAALALQVLLAVLLLCLAPWGLPAHVPEAPPAEPEPTELPSDNPFAGAHADLEGDGVDTGPESGGSAERAE